MLVEQGREIDELRAQAGVAQSAATANIPDVSQLEEELARTRHSRGFRTAFKRAVGTLVIVAAVAVLVTTLFLPVLRIYGTSMTPTLQSGQLVVAVKTSNLDSGDVIAFKYDNKILVKRVIARSGQWVDIDSDGNVTVDGVLLDEPYVDEKSLGDCDIALPYQVPDGSLFVMGDHRSTSVDSRSTALGCVAQEQIVGKAVLCIWPFDNFGLVD